MRFVRSFARFWYDFIIGDDWRVAAGVVAALALGVGLVVSGRLSDGVITLTVLAVIVVGLLASLHAETRG
jgi:hypothetical protein